MSDVKNQGSTRPKILLIEDDSTDVLAVRRLNERGVLSGELEVVDSVRGALEWIDENHADLVLVDYLLPDGTGLELLDGLVETPVIVLTGYGNEQVAVEAMKLGARDYLMKDPHGHYLDLLPCRVEMILRHRRVEDQLRDATYVHSIAGMFKVDDRGELLSCNESFAEMLGFQEGPREVLAGGFCLWRSPAQWRHLAKQLGAKSVMKRQEAELCCRDGGAFWGLMNLERIVDSEKGMSWVEGSILDLTGLRESENLLLESETRYRDLFESSVDLIQSVGPKGEILFVNQSWCELLGYSLDEAAHLNMVDVIHPISREHCSKVFERVMKGERVDSVEAVFLAKSGQPFYVSGNVVPRVDGDRVIGTHGFFRDVTNQKESETLRGLQLAILTSVAEGTTVAKLAHLVGEQIPTLSHILGCYLIYSENPKSAPIEVGSKEFPGSLQRSIRHGFQNRWRGGLRDDGTEKYVKHLGRRTFVNTKTGARMRLQAVTIRAHDGSVDGCLAAVLPIGIVDKGKMETLSVVAKLIELAIGSIRRESDLNQSQRELADSQAMAGVGTWKWEIGSGRVYWSDEVYKIYGVDPSEGPQSLSRSREVVLAEDREALDRSLGMALSGERPYSSVHRIRRPDGRVRFLSEKADIVLNDEGVAHVLVGTVQDVTELKRTEEELVHSKAAIQAIHRAQTRYISESNTEQTLEELLDVLLSFTKSEYGFLGEVVDDDGSSPYLKIHAVSVSALATTAKEFFDAHRSNDMRFDNLETLFGAVIKERDIVIANDPKSDPRSAGLPPGHPNLDAFMGIPLYRGHRLLGMVGLANCPGGFCREQVKTMDPFLSTCASLIVAIRRDQRRVAAEQELHQLNVELEKRVAERTLDLQNSNRRLQDEIAERQKVVAELERTRNAMESALDGVAILDPEGVFTYINAEHLKMFGYREASELIGRKWQVLYDESEVTALEAKVFPELGRNGKWRGEVIGKRKDGTRFDEEISLTLIEGGRLICACRDVSDRKKAEEKLRLANQQLEESGRHKDLFLASVSHELRTPLNAILGMSEALGDLLLGDLNERQRKSTRVIHESGTHLLELIDEILDISRVEAGKVELHCKTVSVVDICESALRLVRQLAKEKDITVSFQSEIHDDFILADAKRLKQILINLLTNAVKFTPSGGQVGLTAAGQSGDSLILSVKDSGIGISVEDQKTIFEPFQKAASNSHRSADGTGLGLALVASLAKLHGGNVVCRSELGQGSEFVIQIPWPFGDVKTELQDTVVRVGSEQNRGNLSQFKLLLVEDNDASVETIGGYLRALGARVDVVGTGPEALDYLRKKKPDLVLMDVQLPGLDGLSVTRELRHTIRSHVPVIAITAMAMSGDEEKCLEAGANVYLSKPVRLKSLGENIFRLLNLAAEREN